MHVLNYCSLFFRTVNQFPTIYYSSNLNPAGFLLWEAPLFPHASESLDACIASCGLNPHLSRPNLVQTKNTCVQDCDWKHSLVGLWSHFWRSTLPTKRIALWVKWNNPLGTKKGFNQCSMNSTVITTSLCYPNLPWAPPRGLSSPSSCPMTPPHGIQFNFIALSLVGVLLFVCGLSSRSTWSTVWAEALSVSVTRVPSETGTVPDSLAMKPRTNEWLCSSAK